MAKDSGGRCSQSLPPYDSFGTLQPASQIPSRLYRVESERRRRELKRMVICPTVKYGSHRDKLLNGQEAVWKIICFLLMGLVYVSLRIIICLQEKSGGVLWIFSPKATDCNAKI